MSKNKTRKCVESGCNRERAIGEFCRLHYLKNWKEIVEERRTKAREALNKYVENLHERHPDDFMDVLKSDIEDEEVFKSRLNTMGFKQELEGGKDSPFDADTVDELLDELDFDEK